MRNRIAFFGGIMALALTALVDGDDNVREVQTKLSNEGLYSGEIDGAYSSDLSAALTRYQAHNGLPITGQLDTETSERLGAKPAVVPSTPDTEQASETWRRLRRGERRTTTKTRETSSARTDEAAETSTETANEPVKENATTASGSQSRDSSSLEEAPPVSSGTAKRPSAPAAASRTLSESTKPTSPPPATASDTPASAPEFSAERLRDYVAAYVLAGRDRNVGAEVEFFADRVEYYDQGTMERERIREDLTRYDERWPERHFWLAGNITIEPQSDNRVRATFPLGFKLRNGNRVVSGKVTKSLVLEAVGDDLQIFAVNERKD